MSVDQNADYWQRDNWSSDEWVVYLREGRPSVRTQKRSEDDRGKLPFAVAKGFRNVQVAKVADGWIVASNYGEFGAELWWFSPEGKSQYQISREHVRGFLQNDRALFALEGLAHMSTAEVRFFESSVAQTANGGPNEWWIWEVSRALQRETRTAR
jgi:hypothetical protein